MLPGPGADVDDLVRGVHGFLVVLHHQQGIAQITQMLKSFQELAIIPLVQADAGLVQNVEHTGQAAADLGSQANTLGFATGQGSGTAVQS